MQQSQADENYGDQRTASGMRGILLAVIVALCGLVLAGFEQYPALLLTATAVVIALRGERTVEPAIETEARTHTSGAR
jgi:hypothetical protein